MMHKSNYTCYRGAAAPAGVLAVPRREGSHSLVAKLPRMHLRAPRAVADAAPPTSAAKAERAASPLQQPALPEREHKSTKTGQSITQRA